MIRYLFLFCLVIGFNSTAVFVSGASAQNIPHDQKEAALIDFYVNEINADSLRSYVLALETFGTRFCLASNRKEVARWIQNKLWSFGYAEARLDSFRLNRFYAQTMYETMQYNVIARLNGKVNPDSVYVLGAHYDSVVSDGNDPFASAPGADDNATGVAAMLEVARIMQLHDFTPDYSIEFVAFAAEELGLHGAWDYTEKALGMRIGFMLNNDMIGHAPAIPSLWKLKIQRYPNSDSVTQLARHIAENHTLLGVEETTQSIQHSDSWPFYARGFQAIFLCENMFTPYYHTVNDVTNFVNELYLAEMTKVSMGMLVHVNTSQPTPVREAFSQPTLLAYPLPAKDVIHLESGHPMTRACLMDVAGRMLLCNPVSGQYHSMDVSAFAPGIYFIRVDTEQGTTNRRIAISGIG